MEVIVEELDDHDWDWQESPLGSAITLVDVLDFEMRFCSGSALRRSFAPENPDS